YSSFKTKNIDLLSQKDNIVIIGLRHPGAPGGIAGAIDDSRIYSQALTQEQIRELKPNVASKIKPYAWWDFEDEKAMEKTGRFPFQRISPLAEVKDGKLHLMFAAGLVAGRTKEAANRGSQVPVTDKPYVAKTPQWPKETPKNWPIYHLAHPNPHAAGPFDPNSAIYYKGRYHLHYIYKENEGFMLGHVSSTDMVNWKWHPTVLAPKVNGHGMFSGTAFLTKEGTVAHTYCGWGSNRNWIQHALDDNLDSWSKPEMMLPNDKDGKPMVNQSYFDPDIWIMDGKYYGLNAQSSSKPPLIMKSDDLKNWEMIGELLHPDFDEKKLGVKKSEDISCPNFFKLGDKWVLVCISHRLGCRYFIGDFVNEQFLPEYHAVLGGSSNIYFAPESLKSADGRRVNWSWYRGVRFINSIQSLPTELELPADGIMRIRPIAELEQLRYNEQVIKNLSLNKDTRVQLGTIKGNHHEIEIVINDSGEKSFGIEVLGNNRGQDGVRVKINREKNTLEVGDQYAPFTLENGEKLTLRVFVDGTLVEVFANERQVVMSDKEVHKDADIYGSAVLFTEGQDLKVDQITSWDMKSTYNNPENFNDFAKAKNISTSSPDGTNAITLTKTQDKLFYGLSVDGQEVLKKAELSITIDGKKYPGAAAVKDIKQQKVKKEITPVVPMVSSSISEQVNETLIQFDGGVSLRIHAANDGVAYRWESKINRSEVKVNGEELSFDFAKDFKTYYPIANGHSYFSSHENDFEYKTISQVKAKDRIACVPLLFELGINNKYMLFSDVNLEGYPGMWVKGLSLPKLEALLPHYPLEVDKGDRFRTVKKYADYLAITKGTRSYPWRAFVLGTPETFLTSNMLFSLAEENRIKDPTWI
ncbi:MAG: glycoside hydrolase family 97 N-terminal domain-containing protein, partial [Aquabacterium sp.]|nr:glycoside hydrolase family 97 N-terminal domain-containing protein [Aquabacterium sp.]